MTADVQLPHLVREPRGEPAGALVLLHGRGTSEHDLHPVLDVLDPRRRLWGLTPGGPLQLPPGGRHWYAVRRVGFPDPATFHETLPRLTAFLDGWLADHGIGWDRTVVGGFSQGAVMAYSTGLGRGRPVPAGILAMSGFVPVVEGWQPDLEGRSDLPVMIVHGRADPIIGVEFGRQAHALIGDAGLPVDYREHDGAHHLDPRLLPDMERWVAERLPS